MNGREFASEFRPGVIIVTLFAKQPVSALILAVIALLCGSLAWASPVPPAGGGIGVTIQVEVHKDGQAQSGLMAEDFLVRDKGKEVPVVDVLEVDLKAGGENLPEEAYRQLLLLFDLEFSEALFVVQATDVAKQLISPERLANTRVLIAAHEPGFGLRVELDLTDNRERLLEMLGTIHDEHQRRLGSSGTTAGPVISGDDLITSRASNLESDKGIVQQEQGRILDLVRTLSRLELLARSVPGSTQVVLFSPGFDSSVILGNDRTQRFDAAWSAEQSEASARGNIAAVDGAARYGGGLVEKALFEMLSDYARSGVPIQGVKIEIRGDSRPVERGLQGPNGLNLMATRTGGEVFQGTRDELTEMTQALQPPSFYLLTFQPRSVESGRYRKLDVRLKDRLEGVEILAPRGYYVP